MTASERELPADFGARVRAARAYKDDLNREEFAELLNSPGAGASTIKAWEAQGHMPGPLAAPTLVQRLTAASGLPEAFFWGDVHEGLGELERIEAKLDRVLVGHAQLTQIEEQVRLLRVELTAHDVEVQKRLDEAGLPTRESRPPPPQ